MGLLDSLGYGNQGGYAGLLDALMYPSPLNKPQEVPQPQFDPMGNFTGIAPQTAQDPFGPPPQLAEWAKQFAPQAAAAAPSPFTGSAPVAPVRQFAGIPVQPAAAPAPETPPEPPAPRMLGIGGYQMPQIGSAADYAPPATDFSAQSRQPPAQPMMQAPAPDAMGVGGKAMTGLQSFLNGGGLISAIRGAAEGKRTDPTGIAQQSLQSQYEALVPVLGPQKARLAIQNPEAGKILLAQALEKRQYGFTKLDNDTLIRTDPLTGKAEVAYGNPGRAETITGPDGKQIEIPAGVDRKTFVNEVSRAGAKAAAGEKTEVQAKSEKFGNKMELSEKNMKGLEAEGTSLVGKIASGIPLGNYAQSPAFQKYTQAKNNFITALLRDESGAAIGTQEFVRYEKELFPQPGDGPEVIQQKAEARRVATEGMKKSAGPGYKSPTTQPGAVRRYNPTTGTIE